MTDGETQHGVAPAEEAAAGLVIHVCLALVKLGRTVRMRQRRGLMREAEPCLDACADPSLRVGE